jgi:hypothetical protein
MRIVPKYDYIPVRPADRVYSRSELAELARAPEEVIAFWGREGIICHSEGGEGRGSHKKYDFAQVNIAAVLSALRRQFAPRTEVLQSLANQLQKAVKLISQSNLYYLNARTAAVLATKLDAFARGETVEVYDWRLSEGLSDRERIGFNSYRKAKDELEIVTASCDFADYDSASDILAAARTIGPGNEELVRFGEPIVGCFLTASDMDNICWIIRPTENGWEKLEISEGGTVDLTIREAAFYIPVCAIIADTWGEDWVTASKKRKELSQMRRQLYAARKGIKLLDLEE